MTPIDADDRSDPNYGPPEQWPWWTDWQCWELGPETSVLMID